MKPCEYDILDETSPGKLIDAVNEAIEDGWQMVGGLVVVPDNNPSGRIFYQAMAKPLTTRPKPLTPREELLRTASGFRDFLNDMLPPAPTLAASTPNS